MFMWEGLLNIIYYCCCCCCCIFLFLTSKQTTALLSTCFFFRLILYCKSICLHHVPSNVYDFSRILPWNNFFFRRKSQIRTNLIWKCYTYVSRKHIAHTISSIFFFSRLSKSSFPKCSRRRCTRKYTISHIVLVNRI